MDFLKGDRRNRYSGTHLRLVLGSTAILLLVPIAVSGQSKENALPNEKATEAKTEGYNFTVVKGPGLPRVFPDIFKKRLLGRISMGEFYESGIFNGKHSNSNDTYTEASASLAYDLPRKRSEYVFDYRTSARHYNRFRELDVVSHDASLSQTLQLGSRATWTLSHRYSMTPDFGGELLQDRLAGELSFANPLPSFGNPLPGAGGNLISTMVNSLPAVNPIPELPTSAATLVTLRSIRISNLTQGGLSYALSPRTALFFQGVFDRTTYQDDNLFPNNQLRVLAGLSRMLNARTGVGVIYQMQRLEQPGDFDLTRGHGLTLSVSRQVTRNTKVNVGVGPWWVGSEGQEAIPLSPVLANLLGRTALYREASLSLLSWMGNANVQTQWNKVIIGLGYHRSVSNANLASMPSTAQSVSLNLGRPLGRDANISASTYYQQNEFLAIRNFEKLDQAVFALTFTRKLSGSLDLSAFSYYSKLLTPVQAPILYNHSQSGIRFFYHFPRLSSQ